MVMVEEHAIINSVLSLFEKALLEEINNFKKNGFSSLSALKRLENVYLSYWQIYKTYLSLKEKEGHIYQDYEQFLDKILKDTKEALTVFLKGLEGDLINIFGVEKERVNKFIKTKSEMLENILQKKLDATLEKLFKE